MAGSGMDQSRNTAGGGVEGILRYFAVVVVLVANCGGLELGSGESAANGVDGSVDNGDGSVDNIDDDCAKLCRLEDHAPTCATAATCDGGCPNACYQQCPFLPESELYCSDSYHLYVHCLAISAPFQGCWTDGTVLPTLCEPEEAELAYCESHIPR
jgi:hypothetical protein